MRKNKILIRFAALFCCALVLVSMTLVPKVLVSKTLVPKTLAEGMLVMDEEAPETKIVQDRENGVWVYDDGKISIHINRYSTEKPYRVWFVTDIRTGPENPITNIFAKPEKKDSWRYHKKPYEMAGNAHAILAINDDYWQYRAEKGVKVGIVIKDGEIISDKAAKSGSTLFPNQDVFAIFADGSAKTFQSSEHTAQEYIDMGVVNTLTFGPILVQGGKLGPHMEENDKFFRDNEAPRTAIGCYSPYHYVILTVQNTVKPGSKAVYTGYSVKWLANKMMELGVQEAINLDGGGSTFLIFMGEMLNRSENFQPSNIRSMSSMISIGTLPEELWDVYSK